MISEGSCDTEDRINDVEYSAFHHRNQFYFKIYENKCIKKLDIKTIVYSFKCKFTKSKLQNKREGRNVTVKNDKVQIKQCSQKQKKNERK